MLNSSNWKYLLLEGLMKCIYVAFKAFLLSSDKIVRFSSWALARDLEQGRTFDSSLEFEILTKVSLSMMILKTKTKKIIYIFSDYLK